jgi:hypothetical protein
MPIIKFHPFSEGSVNFAMPPQPASKFLPAWYKRQPSNYPDKDDFSQGIVSSTIKRCMPVFDMMTAGYMITAPCDIYIDATNSEELVYSIPASLRTFQNDLFARHDILQYSQYPMNTNEVHKDLLRIFPLWLVETDPGYSCMFINPLHQDDSPLVGFSGVIDTDTFLSDGFFSFTVKKDFKGIIKQGTPLIQIIPFKRDEWSSEITAPGSNRNKIDKQRIDLKSVFINGYKNKFRFKKEYK